jgi:DNA-binding response OmpR family regulator
VLVVAGSEAERQAAVASLGQAWPFKNEMALDCAATDVEALEKLRAKRFALVVVDWDATGGNGGQILQGMKRSQIRVPALVISQLRRDQIEAEIEALGAVFVNKGELDAAILHDAVAESLQHLRPE